MSEKFVKKTQGWIAAIITIWHNKTHHVQKIAKYIQIYLWNYTFLHDLCVLTWFNNSELFSSWKARFTKYFSEVYDFPPIAYKNQG